MKDALVRLKPRAGRYRSLREPVIQGHAQGKRLYLAGTLDNTSDLPCRVETPGNGLIPLKQALAVLGTYPKGALVRIEASEDLCIIDNLRIPVAQVSREAIRSSRKC